MKIRLLTLGTIFCLACLAVTPLTARADAPRAEKRVSSAPQTASRLHFDLEASAGLGVFWKVFAGNVSGFTARGAAALTWGDERWRWGGRLGVWFSPEPTGELSKGMFSRVVRPASARLFGVQLDALLQPPYSWAAVGFGLLRARGLGDAEDTLNYAMPELVVSAGLRLPLGKHLVLHVGPEAGSNFVAHYRFSVKAGVTVGL